MPRRASPLLASLRQNVAPIAVTVTGIALAIVAWAFARSAVEAQIQGRFEQVVTTSTGALDDRLDAYTAMLRAARGMVDALARAPSEPEFRAFASSLDLPGKFPGTQGLGWAVALRPDEVAPHEAAMRAAGHPGYRVWPPGPRPLYSAIDILEPLDWRNQRAIGYDMFSEPVRRAAMQRALDTGEAAASGKVVLVQEAGASRQAGFLVYVAVFSRPGDPHSALRGWVYAPLRSADLVRGTLGGDLARGVVLSVYDGEAPLPDQLLTRDGTPLGAVRRTSDAHVDAGGRPLLLRFAATEGFATRGERLLPLGVLLVGLAGAALLFWITRAEVVGRGRAERAARRTAFLAGSGRALSSSLDYGHSLGRVVRFAAGRVAAGCAICILEPEGPLWRVGHHDAALARALEAALSSAGLDGLERPWPHAHDRDVELPFARATPDVVAALQALGASGAIRARVTARGQTIGAVVLLAGPRERLTRSDEALADDLARLVSAAVDTARLFRSAQDAIRIRDEFLSIASHELKTPLTSLALQSESILAGARRAGSDVLARKAEVIRRNVDRLVKLVASLLDLSRITAGRLELELEDVDLVELAREALDKFSEEARRAGSQLILEADGTVRGRWDRLRLDQVLTNLLSNALKYGPGSPVELRITADESRAVLSVRDHGIGISEEDQARIFERFERAVSKRNYGGFGLGLWIVRQIVDALGGTVRVESTPGEGSTFTVELARNRAERRPPRAAEPMSPPGEQSPRVP